LKSEDWMCFNEDVEDSEFRVYVLYLFKKEIVCVSLLNNRVPKNEKILLNFFIEIFE
jgi:hypothetical protein